MIDLYEKVKEELEEMKEIVDILKEAICKIPAFDDMFGPLFFRSETLHSSMMEAIQNLEEEYLLLLKASESAVDSMKQALTSESLSVEVDTTHEMMETALSAIIRRALDNTQKSALPSEIGVLDPELLASYDEISAKEEAVTRVNERIRDIHNKISLVFSQDNPESRQLQRYDGDHTE